MLKFFFKSLFAFLLFFAAKNSVVAAPAPVNSIENKPYSPFSTNYARSFSANDEELVFNAGGHLILSGSLPSITGPVINILHPSPIGVLVDGGVTGVKIKFNSNAGEGIKSSFTNKEGPSIYSALGSSIKTLELNSGAINSTDTAVYLTSSDSAGTDVIIKEGAFIQGARHAFRWDENFEILPPSEDLTNSFTTQEAAEAGIRGNLTLRISNEGIIAANPRLINKPTDLTSNAFFSTGNSRIQSNVAITNEATGKIYGGMQFGNKTFSATGSYIKSQASVTNRGLISSHQIISDFNTKLTLINEANGIIRIEKSPIAGSEDVTEEASDSTDIFEVYEGSSYASDSGALYDSKAPAPSSIRPQGDNSVVTNYGTIIGNVHLAGNSHTLNLSGGTITGNVLFAGTVNFSNDFSSSAMIGALETRIDRRSEESTARINIGTKTYNITGDGVTSGSTPRDGSLKMTSGTGAQPIISTTFTNDGAIGRLNFEGATTINSGIRLNVNIGENYSYLASGVDYLVIDGDYKNTGITTSDVNGVADSKISINDGAMGSNRIGVLTIHSAARDLIESTGKYKDLVVYIERLAADEFTDDETAKKVYEVIGEIGSDAKGKLKEFQKYVDTNSDLTATVKALKSAAPINDGDIELATMAPIHKMIGAVNGRMNSFVTAEAQKNSKIASDYKDSKIASENKDSKSASDNSYVEAKTLRFCLAIASQENKNHEYVDNHNKHTCGFLDKDVTNLTLKPAELEKSKLETADNAQEKKPAELEKSKLETADKAQEKDVKPQAIWGEAFGAIAKRRSSEETDYNANTYGFAFGYDKKTAKDTLVGASISYAKSDIDLSNKLRGVEIHTYQANLYRSKFYKNNSFWDAIAGIAFNEYTSNRNIPVVSAIATAKYSGINYIGRLRGGIVYNKVRGSNFNFIPEISTTFVKRNTDSYTEQGAETMNLQVRNRSNDYLEGRAGYNISYDRLLKKTDLKYRFHNSYAYNFLNKKSETVANFVGQSHTFTTKSQEDASLSIRLGLGVDASRTEATTLSLDYTVDLMSKFISHTGLVKLVHRF